MSCPNFLTKIGFDGWIWGSFIQKHGGPEKYCNAVVSWGPMTTSVCRRKFQVQAQQEKENFCVIGLPWHNIGFLLEVKLTKWRDAGRAQGVKLTAAADPSRYEAGPNFGWGRGGQVDVMLCVKPQSTKVRGVRSRQHDDPQSRTGDVNPMSAPLTVPICPVPRVSPGQKKGDPLVPLSRNLVAELDGQTGHQVCTAQQPSGSLTLCNSINGQLGHWVCTAQWLSQPLILLQYSAIEFVEINGRADFVNSTAELWWVSTSQWIPRPVMSWHSSMTKPILAGHWVLQTRWPSFESGNHRDQFGYRVVQTQWLVVPAEWALGSTDNHIHNWSPRLTLSGQ
jgi:hypothetical protein